MLVETFFNPLSLILSAAGLILGIGVASLYLLSRHRHARALIKAEALTEIAQLGERVRGMELHTRSLQESKEKLQTDFHLLERCHQQEMAKRIAAEERNSRIVDLEAILKEKEAQILHLQTMHVEISSQLVEIETRMRSEKQAVDEKLLLMKETETKWTDLFKGLSADALRSNNQSFLELAKSTLEKFQEAARGDLDKRQHSIKELVKPVRESLDKFDTRINELEKSRVGAYESLVQQVKHMTDTHHKLCKETGNLVKALRSPISRGRWGEIQLRRVVEMAGMLGHCDFFEQSSQSTEEGRLRPDMIVRLPSKKNIIIDAKAPLIAYLEAIETPEEEKRAALLKDHARHVRAHIGSLGKKSYWDQFDSTPEFVVLFLPGEIFFSAALEQDPSLIEAGVEQNIVLATPTTLIALLRAVAYGWSNEIVSQNAKKVSEMGKELYKRLSLLADHWKKMGKSLNNTIDAYNQAVGSLETRVLVSARQFQTQGAGEIVELDPIDKTPRVLQAPELIADESEVSIK